MLAVQQAVQWLLMVMIWLMRDGWKTEKCNSPKTAVPSVV